MSKSAELIGKTKEYVKELLAGENTGHDYAHTLRVYETACLLAQRETADMTTVALAALLHDVDDRKISAETSDSLERARVFLEKNGCGREESGRILTIIREVSYAGKDSARPSTVEGMCVQDADRLDALGAVGIARTFAYGGRHGRAIYDPDEVPDPGLDRERYYQSRSSSIGHFYEKLLLLEGLMNTETAKAVARRRTAFMEKYLKEFFAEIAGEDIKTAVRINGQGQEDL